VMEGRYFWTSLALITTVLLISSQAAGQMGCCQGMAQGMGKECSGVMGQDKEGCCCQGMSESTNPGKGSPRYDSASEVTAIGTIERVSEHAGLRGGTGIHLAIKTAEKTVNVHLGPALFLLGQDISLDVGDEVEVTGSAIRHEDAEAVLARRLKKGSKILTLRNEEGQPVWSGAARKPIP
jgi:hypothetical protein